MRILAFNSVHNYYCATKQSKRKRKGGSRDEWSTVETGDGLERLGLVPVVVHVQLQHNLISAAIKE